MSVGEECEQFFAYWSKLAPTTRNQSMAGANDRLTLSALHFGRAKQEVQAAYLARKYQRFSEALPQACAKLADVLVMCMQTGLLDTLPQHVAALVADLRAGRQDMLPPDMLPLIGELRTGLRQMAAGGCGVRAFVHLADSNAFAANTLKLRVTCMHICACMQRRSTAASAGRRCQTCSTLPTPCSCCV